MNLFKIETSVIPKEYTLPTIIILSIIAFLILLLIIKSLRKENNTTKVDEKKKEKKVIKEIPLKRTDQIDDPAMARFDREAQEIMKKESMKELSNNIPTPPTSPKTNSDITDEELI